MFDHSLVDKPTNLNIFTDFKFLSSIIVYYVKVSNLIESVSGRTVLARKIEIWDNQIWNLKTNFKF